jgi:hypothetical protein
VQQIVLSTFGPCRLCDMTLQSFLQGSFSAEIYFIIIIYFRLFLNSHLFLVKFTPFLSPTLNVEGRKCGGLWSIRAQLENSPGEVIELIKEHTLKV